jgi:hypothetical protein
MTRVTYLLALLLAGYMRSSSAWNMPGGMLAWKATATFCGAAICSPFFLTVYPDSFNDLDVATQTKSATERPDISLNVPSRKTVIEAPKAVDPNAKVDVMKDPEGVLYLIPSYKYFKVIAKEYSSRSSKYVEGQENLLSPFQ